MNDLLAQLFGGGGVVGVVALVTIHAHLAALRRDVWRVSRRVATLEAGHIGDREAHASLPVAIRKVNEQ